MEEKHHCPVIGTCLTMEELKKVARKGGFAGKSRVMRLLGFTPQKSLYQAWQQDAVLVEAWQKDTYPKIRAEARQVGATIYFADESGIRSDYHRGTTWSPCGETPVVTVTGSRFSLNMLSAVSPRGDFRFMVHEGSVNATVFREFLKWCRGPQGELIGRPIKVSSLEVSTEAGRPSSGYASWPFKKRNALPGAPGQTPSTHYAGSYKQAPENPGFRLSPE